MSYELANRGTTPDEFIRRRSIASFEPILHAAQSIDRISSPGQEDDSNDSPAPGTWQWPPQTLARGRLESLAAWTWDILLTVSPICFFGLAVAATRLDGERQSEYGERVVNLTRLSPTLYPILFAALVSRFFKSLARWLLESDTGIPLGLLEQLFGSQSLAGTIERMLFVRVRIAVGFLVLLVWSISPVGGQSAIRLLRLDQGNDQHRSTIYYAHTLWQFKNFESRRYRPKARAGVNSMYTASLLAPAHRGSAVDLWVLPKIPQWPRDLPKKRGVVHHISPSDEEALSREEEYYASLLGVEILGLEKNAEYNFTIETLYYEFECNSVLIDLPSDRLTKYIPGHNGSKASDTTSPRGSQSFTALLYASRQDESPDRPVPLPAQTPAQMLFASMNGSVFHLFNYSIRPVVLDTKISCDATLPTPDCRATNQTVVSHRYNSHLQHVMSSRHKVSEYHRAAIMEEWSFADYYDSLSTSKYLAGTTFSSGNVTAQWPPKWDEIPLEVLSKRMTTLFNTYYDASVSAFSHANVALRKQPDSPESDHDRWRQKGQNWIPYLNRTEGVSTVRYPVYRVERMWVATFVVITMCLQVLGILGLLLQGLIRGPDVLGYASLLTRENPYIGVPPGGSALDGPTRAKVLGRMYVQLADTLPADDVGHIALREVGQEDRDWRYLNSKRLYQ